MTQQTPPPVSGLASVLSIVQAVVALVPRWLIVAAGLVLVAWLGFELYLNARQKLAQVEQTEAESYKAAKTLKLQTDVDTMVWTADDKKAAICQDADLRRRFGEKEGCSAN